MTDDPPGDEGEHSAAEVELHDRHPTRFRKGHSGNPRGRPKGSPNRGIPYDAVFGRMIEVTLNGRSMTITAAEAFLRQLQAKASANDVQAMGLLLEEIEKQKDKIEWKPQSPSRGLAFYYGDVYPKDFSPSHSIVTALELLGAGSRLDRVRPSARMMLNAWVIEGALQRLGRELTPDEQRMVEAVTRSPRKVRWPDWWNVESSR